MRRPALLFGIVLAAACTFDLPRPTNGVPPPDGSLCALPAARPPVVLVDFEGGSIPSPATSPVGVEQPGTIVQPGANGTGHAATFAIKDALFVDGHVRAQYLATGGGNYDPNAANALELFLRVPAGSPLLAPSGDATLSILHYAMRPGDPWIGPNPRANLTDSEMRGHMGLRLDPAAADRWLRLVVSPNAIGTRSQYYHMYAGRSVSEELSAFGALRGFAIEPRVPVTASDTISLDEIRLVTLPPTAAACPDFTRSTVPAGGGDVLVPIVLANPGPRPRSYRAFVSSMLGVDRQALEIAVHDTDNTAVADTLQAAVGAEGGLGAVELFAADAAGKPTGPSILAAGGDGIAVAAGSAFRGVLVHHVRPEMRGEEQRVTLGAVTYAVRRDSLTTSVLFWDPNEPRLSDPSIVAANALAEAPHTAPPGFPAVPQVPAGWGSADVPIDQVGAYYVSILSLTP